MANTNVKVEGNLDAIIDLIDDVRQDIAEGNCCVHVSSVDDAAKQAAALIVPKWEGQFDTFQHWVNHASSRLAGVKGSVGQDLPAFCIDAKGRRCNVGADFMRARDENSFPIRYAWECETLEQQAARLKLEAARG